MHKKLLESIENQYKTAKEKCLRSWQAMTEPEKTEKEYMSQYDKHEKFEKFGSIADIWHTFTSVELICDCDCDCDCECDYD